MTTLDLIVKIQKNLVDSPIDLAHELSHHYRVFEMSLEIQNKEGLSLNKELIIIASWLHDNFGRNGNDMSKLRDFLISNKCSEKNIDKILKIIKEHSFGKRQSTLESKVVYDADKLEYVNPIRLRLFHQAVEDALIERRKYKKYLNEWNERIPYVYKTLNFPFSRSTFLRLLPEAKRIMKDKIGLL